MKDTIVEIIFNINICDSPYRVVSDETIVKTMCDLLRNDCKGILDIPRWIVNSEVYYEKLDRFLILSTTEVQNEFIKFSPELNTLDTIISFIYTNINKVTIDDKQIFIHIVKTIGASDKYIKYLGDTGRQQLILILSSLVK